MMIYEFKFADPGEGVHEGEILQWHVTVGDLVQNEQLLVEVMTEKVTVELASPVTGKILSLEFQEGDVINVGDVLVKIDPTNEGSSKGTSPIKIVKEVEKDDSLFTAATPFKQISTSKSKPSTKTQKPLAAPSIRRHARDLGIDLHQVPATGPAGRITRNDFDLFRKRKPSGVPTSKIGIAHIFKDDQRIPLRGLRRNISKAMRKSKDTAAHYTYFEEVDMTALEAIRQEAKPLSENYGVKLSYIPLVIKCLIPALRNFPFFNSSLDDENGEIVLKGSINIGIAVNTDDGLVVPVIKNADQKSIWELAQEVSELAEKARQGSLALEDVTGGTFTITSVGNIGGFAATPIIRWPEVAILGLMRSKLRPVVINQNGKPEIAIRKVMILSLTIDHRVVDGAVGAMFTNELTRYMENPAFLLLNEEL
ncbi:MAG: dihydrolipoamide acetyltransferase family protein [Candidatus Hodarchaeales archaeon]|jgi:pyruvate dehydrogenase E2 component (dihydrolipoamide acetyltransferase)